MDEVAAEHYNVGAIVHYGHACLSPSPGKLAVHYVHVTTTRVVVVGMLL